MDGINITDIRDFVYSFIRDNVSRNIHMDVFPKSISSKEKKEGLVVLDFSNSISDLNAFGYGIIHVYLCSHNSDRGNVIGSMESSFNNALKAYLSNPSASLIELSPRNTYFEESAANSLKCCIKEIRLKIK